MYHISRIIEETGEKANDGSHIIYVNGAYRGNDILGQLMHDFSCKDANDMFYDALSKGVRHFKEEGGRGIVCKAVEEFAEKYAEKRVKENTRNIRVEDIKSMMINLKLTADQAMQALNVSPEEQVIIKKIIE